MVESSRRKPFALANWKMAMTIEEGKGFVSSFLAEMEDLLDRVEIVLCPPYTALYAVSTAIGRHSLELGAQDLCAGSGTTHTGEISPRLLVDAGCRWVILGHWEVREEPVRRIPRSTKKCIQPCRRDSGQFL